MGFAIEFVPLPLASGERSSEREGRLVIGDFEEHFFASMEYWREPDYERQWRDGLERILAGERVSCLITSIGRPGVAIGLWWWTLFRSNDSVRAQHAMCLFQSLQAPFVPLDPYVAIPPRKVMTEEGDPISEWIIPVVDIAQFVAMIQRRSP
jgi:hypothetical protein